MAWTRCWQPWSAAAGDGAAGPPRAGCPARESSGCAPRLPAPCPCHPLRPLRRPPAAAQSWRRRL
eukprot:6553914-Lingulodinium_polyedra.AAC.1